MGNAAIQRFLPVPPDLVERKCMGKGKGAEDCNLGQ